MSKMMSGIAALVTAVALVACGGGDSSTNPGGVGGGGGGGGGRGGTIVNAARVTATTGLVFSPSNVSIAPNDTIYYTFESVQHNVLFDTQGAPADIGTTSSTTVKRVFPTAGTYDYHCSLHAGMTGKVTVQ